MATCDIDTINAQACANKFLCGQSEQQLLALIAQIICNINEGGGIAPSGGGFVMQGSGNPADNAVVPADPTRPWLYSDLADSGTLYTWNVATQMWI